MRSSPGIAASRPISPAERRAPRLVGVDVLPQQRDLAHAARHQRAGLLLHRLRRARGLRAAGVGHHAEGAELVAALLHGEERRRAAPRLRPGAEPVELRLGREVGVDRAGRARPRHELGQPVVGLGPHHEIDGGLARHDLRALGLRHAARDANPQVGVRGLQPLEPAELGVDLLRGLLADVAGVQQDEVGVLGRIDRLIALGRQRLGHALAVVDVHLAAVGADVEAGHRGLRDGRGRG